MKKVLPIILTAALTITVIWVAVSFLGKEEATPSEQNVVTGSKGDSQQEQAESSEEVVEEEAIVEEEEMLSEPTPDFLVHTGIVGAVETWEGGEKHITVGEGDETFNLTWSPQYVKVFDLQGNEVDIQEGMQFTSYTAFNKPTVMIYPPRYSPDVIVVDTAQFGIAEQTKLDGTYLNAAGTVQFNIDSSVVLENLAGEAVTAADIVNENVLVFYSVTTRSIPAQATPTKIVVLNGIEF